MSGHTPGPWGLDSDGDVRSKAKAENGYTSEHICTLDHYRKERASERVPNGLLISTAPDGLALAEMVLENDPVIGAPSLLRWIKIVNAASALKSKAEGK